MNKTVAVSRDAALRLAAASIEPVRGYAPHMLDELEGMADGSGLSLEKIMLLQIRNQFQADTEAGCTAFALSAAATTEGTSVVAQNWDNDPAWDPFTVVLTRRPDGKPASMTVTQAGLIAYIGFNDRGMGLCVNTLPPQPPPWACPTTSRSAASWRRIPLPTRSGRWRGPSGPFLPTSSWRRPMVPPTWR